jgi:hypothetical protein
MASAMSYLRNVWYTDTIVPLLYDKCHVLPKKCLKIPEGYSKAEYWRTENTMAKRKMTKGQTTIYKAQHRKLNIEQQKPHKNWGWNQVFWKGN